MAKSSDTLIRLLAMAGPTLIRSYFSTLKIRWHCVLPEKPLTSPVIYALWHQRLLLFAYTHQRQGITCLISRHRDGDLIAKPMEGLGFKTVRGSSTSGGREALKELKGVRGDMGFTPDGPRGPLHRFKSGAIYIAAETGYPIIPSTCSYARAWQFRSWDGFLLPKPFSRTIIRSRAPVYIPPEAKENIAHYRQLLETQLKSLTNETDADFEHFWRLGTWRKPYVFKRKKPLS